MASTVTELPAIPRSLFLLVFIAICIMSSRGQQALLQPATQAQFVNQLPVPKVIDGRGGGVFTLSVTQFYQDLGLKDPKTGEPLLTKLWGYNGSYPGATILAQKNVPLQIFWQNSLIDNTTGRPLPHLIPVDETIEWAFSGVPHWQQYGVPIVTHVHGGHTEAVSDGSPNAWFTPSFTRKGTAFFKGQTEPYYYQNDQDAATLWYHDHTFGITRLNVYAGLAGFYILTDEKEQRLKDDHQLPADDYDVALVIQDRMFTEGGQLHYPSDNQEKEPEPTILPEFFGNFILVNGKIWPVLDVEPRQYRFRVLNGSDSRFYNLFFSGDQVFWQIGSDQGLLPNPEPINQMVLGPGQRKEIIVDFSDPLLWGQTIILRNDARSPYPKGTPVEPATTGRIMAFRVSKPLNKEIVQSVLPGGFNAPVTTLQQNGPTRQLLLFEAEDEYGRLKPMLGTVANGVANFMDDITEHIRLNDTETWEIFNATEDAHPIHLHLVKFQTLSRQKYFATVDQQTGKMSNVRLIGQPKLNNPGQDGWKDTEIMLPGEVTRISATFDLPGLYEWHCHILSHEDHEMMRPFLVSNGDLTAKKEINTAVDNSREFSSWPNPFTKRTHVQFTLSKRSMVTVNVFDLQGRLVQQVFKGIKNEGPQQFEIDGSRWVNGIYMCEIDVNDSRRLLKLILSK